MLFAKSRNYDELLDAWLGWHASRAALRPLYTRFVELANEGAREIGFADTGRAVALGVRHDRRPSSRRRPSASGSR